MSAGRTDVAAFLPSAPDWRLDWEGIDAEYPWIRALRGSTQDPVHHAEGDVWIHTRMVVEELVASEGFRAADAGDRLVLFAAALLHDVCKPQTRAVEPDGRITNRGHSRMGANEARQVLWRMGWPFGLRERVCALIAVHQVPFRLIDRPEWEARKVLAETSLQVENRLLGVLAEADARGRVCADKPALLDNVELFREMARDLGCHDGPFPFASAHSRMQYLRDPEGKEPWVDLYDTTDPAFEVTLMSGMPGSGKSTFIARETGPGGRLEGQEVVSMDRLRSEMGVAPDGNQGTVRQAALSRARKLLAARVPFVWDAINLDWQRRQPMTSLCLDYGARVAFAYVEVSERRMLANNHARKAQVPLAEMDRMLRKWEPPTLAECHALLRVDHTNRVVSEAGRDHGGAPAAGPRP